MIKIIILGLINIVFCYSCTHEITKSIVIDSHNNEIEFVSDTSINHKIFLDNPESIVTILGDISKKRNKESDLPDVYLVDKNSKQYLRMIFLPGGSKNNVGQFEIGYIEDLPDSILTYSSPLVDFTTESKIKLGLIKDYLISIKGNNFSLKTNTDVEIVKYTIDDFNNSSFLQRHNMPSYFFECEFKNNKIIKIKFGFDYP